MTIREPNNHPRFVLRFAGEQLQVILRRQQEPVCVLDTMGAQRWMSGKQAADTILDDVVGFGHRRRIKVVKPSRDAIERARQARIDLRTVLQHDPRPDRVQSNIQEPGAKRWTSQPTKSRSGQAGGMRRPRFKR